MLTYVVRRVLYSIPVLLIASFLLFAFVRATFDPTARLRSVPRPRASSQRERERLGLERARRRPVQELARRSSSRATGARAPAPASGSYRWSSRALWNTLQLIFWGILFSAVIAVAHRRLLGRAAVLGRRLHVHRRCPSSGLAMPPFWFGLIAIQFLAVYPKDWFGLDRPPAVLRRAALRRASAAQPRLLPPPGPAGAHADRADHRRWSRYQRASMLDVLNADYIRTARAKGVPRAQGDLQARLAQRPHPARHGHGARHRRAVRRPDHHRDDLLDPGHGPAVRRRPAPGRRRPCSWPGCSSPPCFIIAVQPARRRALRRPRPADPATREAAR